MTPFLLHLLPNVCYLFNQLMSEPGCDSNVLLPTLRWSDESVCTHSRITDRRGCWCCDSWTQMTSIVQFFLDLAELGQEITYLPPERSRFLEWNPKLEYDWVSFVCLEQPHPERKSPTSLALNRFSLFRVVISIIFNLWVDRREQDEDHCGSSSLSDLGYGRIRRAKTWFVLPNL